MNKFPVIVTLYSEGRDSGSSGKSCEDQAQGEADPGEWQCLGGLWVVVRVSLRMQHWDARRLCGERRPHGQIWGQSAREEDLSTIALCGVWISGSRVGGDPKGSPVEAGGSRARGCVAAGEAENQSGYIVGTACNSWRESLVARAISGPKGACVAQC